MKLNVIGVLKYKRKIIYSILVCAFVLLVYNVCIKTSPISLNKEKVYSISLSVDYSAQNKSMVGDARITDKDEIQETISILNSIKAYRGFYSADNISETSPSASIVIYDSKNDTIGDSYEIHYDIIASDKGDFYRIKSSENDKIGQLCQRFGECYIGEY